MKLSLAWIFDHIDADLHNQNIDEIVRLFNKTTAEIESFYTVSFDLSHYFLATVQQAETANTTIVIPELDNKTITLSARGATTGHHYLIKKDGDRFAWATLADFGTEKEGLVPALYADQAALSGSWRNQFEAHDFIIEVDNKSITHRPDMWGHRGFAREIAAFLKLDFKSKQHFFKEVPVVSFEHTSEPTTTTPITIENRAGQACRRFAGFYFPSIENRPSDICIVSRLLKVDCRPWNFLVDATNYVMLDWSQPLHAYDATHIDGKKIIVRMAQEQEKLTLLDGMQATLTANDLVIADAKNPLCLAGVMGGQTSGISSTTTTLFLEAATFDAGTVRRSAQRHKVRTDSSARFEKTLDPNQTTEAIFRFLKLLDTCKIKAEFAREVIAVGPEAQGLVIEVEHTFLEDRMGVKLSPQNVIELLSRLEFGVLKSHAPNEAIMYLVSVPSFRASKDVKIKEDILEEVVRAYGFDKLTMELPHIIRTPFDTTPVTRLSKIKQFLAFSANMTEQQNYSLCDEQWQKELGITYDQAASILNPVSENFYRMIASLVPGLFKNIKENHVHHDALAFFECGRVWQKDEKNGVAERKRTSGVILKKRATVDFYEMKFLIIGLFKSLGFNTASMAWKKVEQPADPWYQAYQTAEIWYTEQASGRAWEGTAQTLVGSIGKVSESFLQKLSLDAQSEAFVFDLDGDFLLTTPTKLPAYHEVSKFQETYFDVSLFVPLELEVARVEQMFVSLDPRVTSVKLIDFFEKDILTRAFPSRTLPEETNTSQTPQRAITLRVWISDKEKTLEKQDIEGIWKQAVAIAQSSGAKVRM